MSRDRKATELRTSLDHRAREQLISALVGSDWGSSLLLRAAFDGTFFGVSFLSAPSFDILVLTGVIPSVGTRI